MKDFIEKLIGRLEINSFPCTFNFETEKYLKFNKAIEIVNQLAEKYKGKYVSKDEVGYMLDTIKMRGDETWMDYYHKALKGLCQLSGGEYNNGWIPCSERLPEEYVEYLCCDKYGEYIIGYPVARISSDDYYVETEHEIMNDCIAWMPLPAKFEVIE